MLDVVAARPADKGGRGPAEEPGEGAEREAKGHAAEPARYWE